MWAKVLPVFGASTGIPPGTHRGPYRDLLKCSLSDPSPGTNLRFYPGANWPQQDGSKDPQGFSPSSLGLHKSRSLQDPDKRKTNSRKQNTELLLEEP